MNISQPVPSAIGSVDFGFLGAAEIKALSVKRIQNSTTFDTLLHAVPGGLYDPALGAWGDNLCAPPQNWFILSTLTRYEAAQHVI
jgi:DNA-directed RNA polymerase I subunit RPA1